MPFILDTELSSRSTRSLQGPANRASTASNGGAAFKETMTRVGPGQERDAQADPLDGIETGHTSILAILAHDTPATSNLTDAEAEPNADLPIATLPIDIAVAAEPELVTVSAASESENDLDLTPDEAVSIDDAPEPTPAPVIAVALSVQSVVPTAAPATDAAPETPVDASAPMLAIGAATAPVTPHAREIAKAQAAPEADIMALPGGAVTGGQSTATIADHPAAKLAAPAANGVPETGPVPTQRSETPAQVQPGSETDKTIRQALQRDIPEAISDQTASSSQTAARALAKDAAASVSAGPLDGVAVGMQSLQATPAPATAQAATFATVMTPVQGLITATPAQIVDIVADNLGTPEDRKDRIVVQLDPPELGRVSIDFKFDVNGLQHVTVTGETPEALRQLRLMHFELVNALERQGLSGQNMSFQQHQPPQDHGQHGNRAGLMVGDRNGTAELAPPTLVASQSSQLRSPEGGGLNIKI